MNQRRRISALAHIINAINIVYSCCTVNNSFSLSVRGGVMDRFFRLMHTSLAAIPAAIVLMHHSQTANRV